MFWYKHLLICFTTFNGLDRLVRACSRENNARITCKHKHHINKVDLKRAFRDLRTP